MGNKLSILFWIILLGAGYHLIRDILQIIGIDNIFIEIGHWEHQWCRNYCDFVTLPLDIFVIVMSAVIVKRKKVGTLGVCILIALLVALFMWLWK